LQNYAINSYFDANLKFEIKLNKGKNL